MGSDETPAEIQLSEKDAALIDRIKQQWYFKTWQEEEPKSRALEKSKRIINYFFIGIFVLLLIIFSVKTSSLNASLAKSNILLFYSKYYEAYSFLYFLVILSATLLFLDCLTTFIIDKKIGDSLINWHNSLSFDKRRLAIDIIQSGKSHNMYFNASLYLYNLEHGKNGLALFPKLKKAFCKVQSWRSVILHCIVLSVFALFMAWFIFNIFKSLIEKSYADSLGIKSSFLLFGLSDLPVALIFIIVLLILIAALLAIPYVFKKKVTKWIDEQIENGALKSNKE